jgi:hypothetical protein
MAFCFITAENLGSKGIIMSIAMPILSLEKVTCVSNFRKGVKNSEFTKLTALYRRRQRREIPDHRIHEVN